MLKQNYAKYYQKRKNAAKELGRFVRDVKLGQPENKCECPSCERTRRRNRNNQRKNSGSKLPQDSVIEKLPVIIKCPCIACNKRREAEKRRRKIKKLKVFYGNTN